MYTLRKCTVEHPFGTIKRSLGYTYFLRRGLKAVNTEAALIAMTYNIKRLVNISKIDKIIKKMEDFFLCLYDIFLVFSNFTKKSLNSYRTYDFQFLLSILCHSLLPIFHFIGQSLSYSLKCSLIFVFSSSFFSFILLYQFYTNFSIFQ